MTEAATSEKSHQQVAPSFDGLPRRQRRRLVLRAFVRTIATVAVIVVAYFIAPLNHAMSPVTIIELVLLALAIFAMIGWQIWRITQSDYPTLRAVEALAFIVPAYLGRLKGSPAILTPLLPDLDDSCLATPVFDLPAVNQSHSTMVWTRGLSRARSWSHRLRA